MAVKVEYRADAYDNKGELADCSENVSRFRDAVAEARGMVALRGFNRAEIVEMRAIATVTAPRRIKVVKPP